MKNQNKKLIKVFNRELPASDFWQTPPNIYYYVNQFYESLEMNYFDPCPKDPKDDGLLIQWNNNVYINPPYSKGQLKDWIKKGLEEYETNSINQIWVLNYSNSKTLQPLKEAARAFCDLNARIKFIRPNVLEREDKKEKDSPQYNNVIYYLGAYKLKFQEIFSPLGKVFLA